MGKKRWERVTVLAAGMATPKKAPEERGPSDVWDALLRATAGELRALLEFARDCGAELVYGAGGWRIEARQALGDEYPAWREAMMSHVAELQAALSALATPGPKSALGQGQKIKPLTRCAGCGQVVVLGEWEELAEAAWCAVCWKQLESRRC